MSALHQQVQQLLAVNLLTESGDGGAFELTQNLDSLLEAKFLEKHSFSSSHVKRAQSQGFNPDQHTPSLMQGANLLKKFENYQNIATLISGENNGAANGGGPSDFNKEEESGEDGGAASSSSGEADDDDIIDDAGDEDYQLLMQGAGQETIDVLREIERGTHDHRSNAITATGPGRAMRETSLGRDDMFFSHLTQEEQLLLMSSDLQRKNSKENNDRCTRNDAEQEKGEGFENELGKKSRMTVLIPPPNPLLPKMMLPDEAVRNGFLKKYIDLGKRPRIFEKERAPCGPVKQQKAQQLLTPTGAKTAVPNIGFSQTVQQLQPIPEYPSTNPQVQPSSNNIAPIPSGSESNQQVDDFNNLGNESSLRSFFYMEYRKMQSTEKNPIVYSRFGKQNYDSEEKFCQDSFSQLIRTCNIKRLLKGLPGDMNLSMAQIQQQMQQQLNQYNRFKEENRGEIRTFPQESAPNRPYYIPYSPQDTTLVFESRFESGNLQLAHKVSDKEYNLILQNDLNSKGHTQWFYFRIQNTRKGAKVKFNMLNFLKSKSLFNEGMKVLTYSEKKLEHEGSGWHRSGEDISYFQNNYRREAMTNYQRFYHTFTFTYKFEYDNDTVFFAYSQPYTYSDLMDDITVIEKMKLDYVSRNILCRTLAGNRCDYLTITSRSNLNPIENNQNDKQTQKKGVVISSRVHPGESNSSWMMKGVIDFLISDCKEAKELRDNFVFKIIPMLNPDGVINGNYRCSLAGCDLNRRWKNPSPILHPTVYTTKQLILQFSKERPLLLYCDLHGHSRRKNVFMYGNSDSKNPEAFRIFPYLMSKISGPLFSYDYSRFKVQRNKEQTARIALWRELKNPNIFTMEASFCGPKYLGPSINISSKPEESQKYLAEVQDLNYHYTADDLMEVGKKLCQTITLYNASNIDTTKQIEEIKSYHQKKQQTTETASNLQPVPTSQTIPVSAHKSLERNSNLTQSAKSEARTKAFQRRNTAGLDTGASQQPVDSDSDANSTTILGGQSSFSLKDIVKELKQKMQAEKAAKRVSIMEQDDENNDGSSDEDSDSGESEDNLDADQLVAIMPKRIIKKNGGTNTVSNKRKKGKGAGIFGPKKVMKEDADQLKKDQEKNASQRRQSIRSLRDFKKPTQSFLQKFGLVGPTNKVKFGQNIQKREFCTQTIDLDGPDADQEIMDCELSAMERDIMLCTGCIPDKLKRLARTSKFEGQHSHMFINLVRLEASRLKGVNTPLPFRRENESIIIGKNTGFSIAQIQSPVPPHRISSSQICSGDDSDATAPTHRIRLDLSKVQDKVKDARKSNVLGENNGLKNVQVIYSKNENAAALSAKNGQGYQSKNADLSVKENSDSMTVFTGQLSIAKANSTQQSNARDKSAPNGTSTFYYENYDTQSTLIRSGQENKKNFRVIDLNNLRQDSTHSLKITGGLVSFNMVDGAKNKGSNFDNKKKLETENMIENELFNNVQSEFKNEPQIIPRSQIAQPMDITAHNAALANRSLSYHRKISQPTNQGNVKARLTLQGSQKTPQTLQSNLMSNNVFSQPQQQVNSQTQNQNNISQNPRGQSNDSSLKNIWDSMSKVGQTKTLNAQAATNPINPPSSLSPSIQINNHNRFTQYLKSGDIVSSGLERIEEKQSNGGGGTTTAAQARSSSQGNYSGTSKFQSMKAKLTPNLKNGKQTQKGPQLPTTVTREEHLISAISNRNTVTSINNLNSVPNGALLTGSTVTNGALKKQLQNKQPQQNIKKDRQTMSANQSQYVMGLLHLSSSQQQQAAAVGQPITRM